MANNPVAISDVDNEVLRESDEYLRKHKVLELFEVSTIFHHSLIFWHLGSYHFVGLQATRSTWRIFSWCPQAKKIKW